MPTTASEVNDFYAVPAGVTNSTGLWIAALNAVQTVDRNHRADGVPIVSDGTTPVPAPGESSAQLEVARAFVANVDGALQAIRTAAEAGGQVRFPIDYSNVIAAPLPRIQDSRAAAWFLQLDAHVAAHDGSASRVLQDYQAMFALSDTLSGEPTIISQRTTYGPTVGIADAA